MQLLLPHSCPAAAAACALLLHLQQRRNGASEEQPFMMSSIHDTLCCFRLCVIYPGMCRSWATLAAVQHVAQFSHSGPEAHTEMNTAQEVGHGIVVGFDSLMPGLKLNSN
jgi:hypothetical protein